MTHEPKGRKHGVNTRERSEEYTRRWPEILKRLEELKSITGLARELGISYATCDALLKRRGVDVSQYKPGSGWHIRQRAVSAGQEVEADQAAPVAAAIALPPASSTANVSRAIVRLAGGGLVTLEVSGIDLFQISDEDLAFITGLHDLISRHARKE